MHQTRNLVWRYSRQVQRKAWQASRNSHTQQQLTASVAASKDKLDILAKHINGLSQAQQKLLQHLLTQDRLAQGQSILEARLDWAETHEDTDARSYLVQAQAKEAMWSRRDLLSFLVNPEAVASKEESKAETKVKEVYDVELTSVSASEKIKVIKAIREALNLGLKEAKELVEKTPVVIKQAKKDEADTLADLLTKAGCVITLK